MRNSTLIGVWALLLMFFGRGALAQTPQGELTWEGDVDKAFVKAKEQKKPVLVLMHKEKEIACTRMVALYDDPDVKEKLKDFILIPTNLTEHKMVKMKVGTEERECCPKFHGITCAEHAASEQKVRERFMNSNTVIVPQHVLVDPDGKMLLSKIYEMKKFAFLDFLDRCRLTASGISEETIDPQTKGYLGLVKTGPTADREKAVKAILEFNSDPKTQLLYGTIQDLNDEKDRAACIRAMGYENYPHAGTILVKWLKDESVFIQNCAVVSLEETKAPNVTKALLELNAKAKDPELKKDIARALGPCGGAEKEVQTLLLGYVKSPDEIFRQAAYMSLGYFLAEDDVRALMMTQFAKETDITLKTAILWGFRVSGDISRIPDVEKLADAEKNSQLKTVAKMVIDQLNGKGGIGGKQGHQLMKPLYAKDKIARNRMKEWGSYGR